jgi:DNA (cytosine-5)-methyltransferase 1
MGLDLGLERAGFRVAVAVERNPYAVATIRKNRPGLPVIERPIEDVSTKEILELAGLKRGEPMVVSGGPSCQVFSTAGHRRSLDDPRGTLFEHFVRVVEEAKPRLFVMENVRGLLSAAIKHRPLRERGPGHPPLTGDEELGSALRVVTSELRRLGYYIVFDVLNAADFGAPQVRHRLVFVGSRDGEPITMPEPTHDEHRKKGFDKWRTLRDAIGNLKENSPEFYRFCPMKEKYLIRIPAGGNWRDLPPAAKKKALGRAYDSWGGRSGFFRRLSWDEPSPALTTRPDSKATTLCHPTELRPLSVAEYARIQQFPDDWKFSGMVRKKYEQVGNAVPLGLGEAIGIAIRAAMRSRVRLKTGRVECWNLDLLTKMCRRPRTIVNPPRMRDDTDQETISDWLDDAPRMRDDAFDYVPFELRKALEELVGRAPKTKVARKKKAGKRGPKTRAGSARRRSYKKASRKLWLAAAE